MSFNVNIPAILHHLTNGLSVVQVDGDTIGQGLEQLVVRFPGINKVLFDVDGKLLNYIDVLVNGESAYPEDLARRVKDGDEIHLELMIVGG